MFGNQRPPPGSAKIARQRTADIGPSRRPDGDPERRRGNDRRARTHRQGWTAGWTLPQTLGVLAALAGDSWHHGYELAKQTGLKSGTLYPILVRLADRGLVEARWEEEQPAGRPRRHLYRLTAQGARERAQARPATLRRTRPAAT